MKNYKIIVSGQVQGVGYRFNVQRLAASMNLNGTVKNLANGDVEINIQIEDKNLRSFIDKLSFKDSPWIKVTNIDCQETDHYDFNDFRVIY